MSNEGHRHRSAPRPARLKRHRLRQQLSAERASRRKLDQWRTRRAG